MELWSFFRVLSSISLLLLLLSHDCMAGFQSTYKIDKSFQGSQMNWIDRNGLFLLSNSTNFGFGFITTADTTRFLIGVMHVSSQRVIWSGNRGTLVSNSDQFIFSPDGKVSLQKGKDTVWAPDTGGKRVSAIALEDSGNLVLLGDDSGVIWQSFSHPTDTLMSSQDFSDAMRLVSDPSSTNLTYILEIKSGDMVLSAGFKVPQTYWSLQGENRKTTNKDGGKVTVASLDANSWRFYDGNNVLLSQFVFSPNTDANATWVAVLGNDGFISFYDLDSRGSSSASSIKIPDGTCSTPEACGPYVACSGNNRCQCLSALAARPNCQPGIVSPCGGSNGSTQLVSAPDVGSYFALSFATPSLKTDLEGCKSSCQKDCSCLTLFFDNSSRNCFLFDEIGSFQSSDTGSAYVAYIKVPIDGSSSNDSSKKSFPIVVIIVITTLVLIAGLLYGAFRYYKREKRLPESPHDISEDDNFLGSLSGMPIRFTYKELETATNNFTVKLGQGGFGSVYQGALPDGSRLAVKQLEGVGQGKKEFRAEVSIIGSIHHHHLVRLNLKGYCAEGSHRLLAYEFMANGSLEKWIFRDKEGFMLDWETRFIIALGTAKGLAYLHEDCDVKIVHCDIKPENVLLDDNFQAKVSDFGLAKLMSREQSHVFTTLRGTRGYLAPEWITSYAISEKSDVYSYGMLLLEIIGGRKNYVPSETSDKSHFPSFAFRMMGEGKLRDILDSKLKLDESDERVSRAVKVALWCIQDEMSLRPSMTKVVQMLEGICIVTQPPISSPLGSRLYSGFFKSTSEEGGTTSLGPSDCNSEAFLSAVRLSGPR